MNEAMSRQASHHGDPINDGDALVLLCRGDSALLPCWSAADYHKVILCWIYFESLLARSRLPLWLLCCSTRIILRGRADGAKCTECGPSASPVPFGTSESDPANQQSGNFCAYQRSKYREHALVATGSPLPPVHYVGKSVPIAQCTLLPWDSG
jgi:hypothetical protein